MRAAIYARFSTDKQRETSIDDQARVCRGRIDAEGWEFVDLYADSETSGRSLFIERTGAARMLADARARRFDVLVVESLQRPFRDLVDQETIVRRIEHAGLVVIGITDGYDTRREGREIMRALFGSINEGQLREIGAKTHRGLAGQIERGFHAGGISYGYRSVVAGVDAKGESIGHRLEVDDEQAAVVREIFRRYAAGEGLAAIVHDLNARHVAGPRGTWNVTALYGSPAKGSGVLNNEVYIGRYIWNRSKWVKDPDTRKRSRVERPRNEWRIEDRPELRIVDDALWKAVRARMDTTRLAGGRSGKGARVGTLLGGLMTCGVCGGAVTAVDHYSYGCAARKDRGPAVCRGVRAPRKAADLRITSAIRDYITSPESIAELRGLVTEILTERQSGAGAAEKHRKARLAELEREIANLVGGIAVCGVSPALKEKLGAAEAEREALQQAAKPVAIARGIDDVMARYRRLIADLPASLQNATERSRRAVRMLTGGITLLEEGGTVYAELNASPERLLMASGGTLLGMVAGTRYPSQKSRIQITGPAGDPPDRTGTVLPLRKTA